MDLLLKLDGGGNMRKLVETNLIEKTKNFEEQAYRRWHLQRNDSAFAFLGQTSTGQYTLTQRQIKPYCESHKAYRWTSGSTFVLELELSEASKNLSQFRVVYTIYTGNKIREFRVRNTNRDLVFFWNLLGDGKRRLTNDTNIYATNNLSEVEEFYIVIDFQQGMYTVYLTDDPDI